MHGPATWQPRVVVRWLVHGSLWRVVAARERLGTTSRHLFAALARSPIVPLNWRARLAFAARRTDMDDPVTLAKFWRQRAPHWNTFDTPPASPKGETVVRVLRHLGIPPTAPVLEVGCNVGRNLHHLWQAGFQQVAGLDISAIAVSRLRAAYPALASNRIDVGSAEVVLATYPAGAHAVVFTMAVLEHMHPTQRVVFAEIARVARDYVIAIEPARGHASHRQYPWDVRAEFEALGLVCRSTTSWADWWPAARTAAHEWDRGCVGYDVSVFSRERA